MHAPDTADTANFPTCYADVALTLDGNGWAVVPLIPDTKVPNRREWQYRPFLSPEQRRQIVLEELSWRGGAERRDCACGIVVPMNVLCVDCDLLDEGANTKVKDTLRNTFGAPRMGRIGNPPKWLAMYGVAGSGVLSRKLGGVELFCGSGQIAAFGVHAKTGWPYHWSPINPLNTRPEELPQVTAGQVETFVKALGATGVLQRPVHQANAPATHRGGSPALAPTGRYRATERLHALLDEHGGLVKPAVRQLIAETGQAGHDRHNTIVAVCGFLVHARWLNCQIDAFLTPLANASFGEGDWTIEVEGAVAHARNRERARLANPRALATPRPIAGAAR
jgi:hypothetical protein